MPPSLVRRRSMEKGIARVFSKREKSSHSKPYTLNLKYAPLKKKSQLSVHHEKQETRKRCATP